MVTYAGTLVVDRGQLSVDVVFALAILEQLTESEERCTLEEHFRDDAASAEHVHCLCDAVVGIGFFDGSGDLFCLVEAFWGEVAGPFSAGVVEKGKVRGIVERETGRLVWGKVSEVYPVRGCDEDVGGLDVAVRGVLCVGEGKGCEELVDDPFLFNGGEKGTRAAGTVCQEHSGDFLGRT